MCEQRLGNIRPGTHSEGAVLHLDLRLRDLGLLDLRREAWKI